MIYNKNGMSITDKLNKIKDKTSFDRTTILYLLIMLLVALGSFFLGRFSRELNLMSIEEIGKNNQPAQTISSDQIKVGENSEIVTQKNYVASKNGKNYYPVNCKGANRIKQENMIWFGSEEEAEASGYTFSSTCKQ